MSISMPKLRNQTSCLFIALFVLILSLLQRYPTLPEACLNLGVVYAKAGRYAEARKAWENVLKYAPNDSTTKAYLAKLPGKS